MRSFADYDIDLETFVNEVVLPDCPPPVFALGAFDGRDRADPRRPSGASLVRPHGAAGADDRAAGHAPLDRRRASTVKAMRLIGLGGSYVPGGDASVMMQRPFIGNLLTSDPVRYARNVAVLEAEPALAIGWPTVAWADSAFG